MWGEKDMPAIDALLRHFGQISEPVGETPSISVPVGSARNAQRCCRAVSACLRMPVSS
jgi:hypothetical protein